MAALGTPVWNPAAHDEQVLEPLVDEYLPIPQLWQEDEPIVEYWPLSQAEHEAEPALAYIMLVVAIHVTLVYGVSKAVRQE